MTDHSLKTTSGATGTYPNLSAKAAELQNSGNAGLSSGKSLPHGGQDSPDLHAIADKLNLPTQSIGRELRFEVNMNTHRSVIRVLDRETGEVIREIPPEKARLMAADSGELEIRLLDSRI